MLLITTYSNIGFLKALYTLSVVNLQYKRVNYGFYNKVRSMEWNGMEDTFKIVHISITFWRCGFKGL